MRQATLIALYGDKPAALCQRLALLQTLVQARVGSAFRPYDLGQVHGTLLGLNGCADAPLDNLFTYEQTGERVPMDLDGFLEFARTGAQLPFQLRIGGFAEGERPFESRGASPFERSFSVQGDKVVALGWPASGAAFPDSLAHLRRASERFGVRHKYHSSETDADNDFYFRIGLLQKPLGEQAVTALTSAGRELLANLAPLEIDVRTRDVVLASYDEETLPLASTRTWRLDQLPAKMNYLNELFRE